MEGFGSTNVDSSTHDDIKSMSEDMMGFGSSTDRQMSGTASSGSSGENVVLNSETYRGINLRSSLTDRENTHSHSELQASAYSLNSHETFESYGSKTVDTGGGFPRNEGKPMSRENRLVDAVTTPGGMRLQPSREAVQNFLTAATKLDGDLLGYALQSKLLAHAWQVRLKAMCILEAVLREGDSNDVYQRIAGIFRKNHGCIVENAESPQASLKEKSKKVLDFLGGYLSESRHHTGPGHISTISGSTSAGSSAQQSVVLPDLMDGWDASIGAAGVQGTGSPPQQQIISANPPAISSSKAAADDLLRVFDWNENALQSIQITRERDLLTELSLSTTSTISFDNDLSSELNVNAVHGDVSNGASGNNGLFEGLTFGAKDSITTKTAQSPAENLVDLFGGLTTATSAQVDCASIDPFQGLSSSSDAKPTAN